MAVSRGWIESVKNTKIPQILSTLGLQPGRLASFGPCPGCNEQHRGSDDRRGACGCTGDRRAWKCHRCNIKGDALDLLAWTQAGKPSGQLSKEQWADIRQWCTAKGLVESSQTTPTPAPVLSVAKLLGREGRRRAPQAIDDAGEPSGAVATIEPRGGGPYAWRDGLAQGCAASLWDLGSRQSDAVLAYLREERLFLDETIKAWELGCIMIRGEPWLTIPLRDESERVVNVRFRSIPPAKKTYRVCPGRPLPLFGSHSLGNDLDGNVVVCEGELDVIAMWQYGFNSSVVSGTAGAGAWKEEWLDQLEPYGGFILCYDNDSAGEAGAKGFADKMGLDRCSRAILPKKDAGECLQHRVPEESIRRVLDRAQPMFGVQFRDVNSYGPGIERLIANPEELRGRSTGSVKIDRCLGGLRPGLTIVSGDTGVGKTTFVTWLLWQQAAMGVPVMVTSFEQRPIGTVQKLLRMQLGGDFTKVTASDRAAALGQLGKRPIHILDHYGQMAAANLMQAVRYAVRRMGVKVVLIDHLGFLLDAESQDRVSQIESVIRALAITGYSLGCTLILVCHPRGLAQGAKRVTINDLKGASAIKQDASEVIIVERDAPRVGGKNPRPWPAAWVHFDKVRSEFGVPGSKAQLAFGPMSCRYADQWEETPEGRVGALIVTPS